MPTVTLTLARVTPDDRDDWLEIAAGLLSDRERERLDAMPDPDRRAQHAIGRALLRLIAAGASGRHPADVEITNSGEGKPELAELPELGVSLAHSGRAVVVAACEGAPVGVDIEPARASQRELTPAGATPLLSAGGGGVARAARRRRQRLVRARVDNQGGGRQGAWRRHDPSAGRRRGQQPGRRAGVRVERSAGRFLDAPPAAGSRWRGVDRSRNPSAAASHWALSCSSRSRPLLRPQRGQPPRKEAALRSRTAAAPQLHAQHSAAPGAAISSGRAFACVARVCRGLTTL